jgi:hypothetical protein
MHVKKRAEKSAFFKAILEARHGICLSNCPGIFSCSHYWICVGECLWRRHLGQCGEDRCLDRHVRPVFPRVRLINSSIALTVSQLARDKDRIAIINGSGASRLTGDSCTPNSVHYAYDTYSLAKGTGTAMMKAGGTTWYFLTADYAFGHALEADTSAVIKLLGGEVLGASRYPIETSDQSSFLLQAQASRAKVVGLAGSGTVFVNAVKSAQEFGIQKGGQTLAGLLVWITEAALRRTPRT